MEQLVESLVLGGLSKEKVDRARRRGIAYECLWCLKEGKKTVNIKCRTEEHVVKSHLRKDQVAFHCLLCGFVGLKREQLLIHVSSHAKHVMLAAKLKILDHRPYLWENPSPRVLGADDYCAYSPEASLLHFLGILNPPGAAKDTYLPTGVAAPMLSTPESGASCQPIALDRVGQSTVCTSTAESPVMTVASLQTFTPTPTSPVPSQTVISPVAEQPVCRGLWRPYAPADPVGDQELGFTNVAEQLTALLQPAPGQLHTPTFGPIEELLPLEGSDLSESLEGEGNGNEHGNSKEPEHAGTADSPDTEEPEAEEKVSGIEEAVGDKEGEPDPEASKEEPTDDDRLDDVLELTDEDMTLSTPMKRAREEEETNEPESTAKKVREELIVDVKDLSERTLVETVEVAQKIGKRSIVVSEDLIKVVIDNTCVQSKLVETLNRMLKQWDERERNERRREERRIELEQKREEEWRRAFYRLRDEERRWEERRKEMERRDREERREREERKKKEERKTEEKESKRKESKENQRPQSVLGRVYTRENITDGSRRS